MTSMGELIRAYAASDPWTVAGFVVLLTAATAVGVIGLTKATATLSFQVSTGAKRAAIVTVGVLVLLMVVQRLLMFGVDRLDHAMSTQFREFTTARLMRDVVEANRTTLHDVHPLRYRAYVEASVASSFQVFDACLKTYLPNGVMLVALAAYLFYLDVRYGAALLATLAFAVLAFFAHKDHLAQKTREAEARSRAATTFTYDVLSCIDTVVAKNTHVQELAGVEAALRESAEGTRALGLTMDVGNLVMSGAIIAGVAVITLIGVTKLGLGASAPAILAMLGLVGTLRYRIGSIAAANSAIVGQTSRYEANALPHVSSRPSEHALGQKELCEGGGRTCAGPVRVDFEHVSFKYPGTDRPVIVDFSWSIGPGINVLSAKSGRGKTTLASLVLRLYTPDSGVIRVNGVPLGDLSVDSLRANIVFSNQDMGLLDRTIREVCLYGTTATDQDLAEVWETFKNCFQGISLDDRIGQSGGRMSTGMKQVIRLTNIRLSKSPCVLLDEPFSGLDAENRDAAIGLVRAIAASGRTVLLITHEPDVMLLADNSYRLQPEDQDGKEEQDDLSDGLSDHLDGTQYEDVEDQDDEDQAQYDDDVQDGDDVDADEDVDEDVEDQDEEDEADHAQDDAQDDDEDQDDEDQDDEDDDEEEEEEEEVAPLPGLRSGMPAASRLRTSVVGSHIGRDRNRRLLPQNEDEGEEDQEEDKDKDKEGKRQFRSYEARTSSSGLTLRSATAGRILPGSSRSTQEYRGLFDDGQAKYHVYQRKMPGRNTDKPREDSGLIMRRILAPDNGKGQGRLNSNGDGVIWAPAPYANRPDPAANKEAERAAYERYTRPQMENNMGGVFPEGTMQPTMLRPYGFHGYRDDSARVLPWQPWRGQAFDIPAAPPNPYIGLGQMGMAPTAVRQTGSMPLAGRPGQVTSTHAPFMVQPSVQVGGQDPLGTSRMGQTYVPTGPAWTGVQVMQGGHDPLATSRMTGGVDVGGLVHGPTIVHHGQTQVQTGRFGQVQGPEIAAPTKAVISTGTKELPGGARAPAPTVANVGDGLQDMTVSSGDGKHGGTVSTTAVQSAGLMQVAAPDSTVVRTGQDRMAVVQRTLPQHAEQIQAPAPTVLATDRRTGLVVSGPGPASLGKQGAPQPTALLGTDRARQGGLVMPSAPHMSTQPATSTWSATVSAAKRTEPDVVLPHRATTGPSMHKAGTMGGAIQLSTRAPSTVLRTQESQLISAGAAAPAVLEKEQQPMTVARTDLTVHGHAAGLMYGTRVDAEKRPEAVGLLAAAAAAPQRGTRATASVFSHDWQPGLSGWKDVTDARLQAMQAPSSTVSVQGQGATSTLGGPRSTTEAKLMGARDPAAMVQWHQGKEAPALVVRPHVEGPGTAGRDPHMAIVHRQTHGQQPALVAGSELQVDAAQAPLTWRPDLALPLHRPENMHLARESRKVHANQDLTTASGVADVGSAGRMATQSTRMVGQVIASHRTALPDRAVGNKAFTRMTPVSTRTRTDQDVAMRASPSPRRPGQRPGQRLGARTVAANNKY